jgi:hypothetical protein
MGSVRFGKGAEDKPIVITSEVKELKVKVDELMSVIKNAEATTQNELLRTVAASEKDKKIESEIKYQTKLIKICAGVIILIQIISLFGV